MKERNYSGATLAFATALSFIVIAIGGIACMIVWLMGGAREQQNATDAGSLGVAKEALVVPGITLNNGVESNNFGAYAQSNGQVNLLAYNRLVGQTLLVAMNAQSEQTQAAASNATTLIQTLTTGNDCINQRLSNALSTYCQPASGNTFSTLANSNSTRMLQHFDRSALQQTTEGNTALIAYSGTPSPGHSAGATNVYLNSSILPPLPNNSAESIPNGTMSSMNSPASGQPYINGYTGITVNVPGFGNLPPIAGVPVFPQQQPHLMSASDFEGSQSNPVSTIPSLPPNSFLSSSSAPTGPNTTITSNSYSLVGSLQSDYAASIPQGYIVVKNMWANPQTLATTSPGYDSVSGAALPNPDSIFNNQLYTGIFIANNGCFSTDESLILAWAAYNSGKQIGTAPPLTDPSSGDAILFDVTGNPATAKQAAGITQLGGNGYPVIADCQNVEGPDANSVAANMLPAFKAAYPSSQSGDITAAQLTAAEDLNSELVADFVADKADSTPAQPGNTGMRIYPNGLNYQYVIPQGGSPQVSVPGNVAQLCAQATGASNAGQGTIALNNKALNIVNALKQRMQEMKPNATQQEMNELLGLDSSGKNAVAGSAQALNLGDTFYIWLEQISSSESAFRMTQTLPPWLNNASNIPTPDGQAYTQGTTFPTIGTIVDVPGEYGFNNVLYEQSPPSNEVDQATDTVTWAPSTGFNNLLGQLSFGESIGDVPIVSCLPQSTINAINAFINSDAFDQNVVGQAEHDGNNIWNWQPLPYPQYSFASSEAQIMALGNGMISSVNITYVIGSQDGAAFTVTTTVQQANNTCLSQSFTVEN